jgi:hypothetical protein
MCEAASGRGGCNPARRFIAVDWSGALDPGAQRRGIWVADCWFEDRNAAGESRAVELRSGESRVAVEAFLLEAAAETPELVAGLDFSFSYPAEFLEQLGCADAFEFWDRVAAEGERWLTEPHAQFWGRGKVARPEGHAAPEWLGYRRCELEAKTGNVLPRSSFQIGGAGAVGTGSLRGIPMLARLRRDGFHVWPFDRPGWPLVVEIYPRLLTGPVVKSRAAARVEYLGRGEFAALPSSVQAAAEGSENAFDALVSAWRMREWAAGWAKLRWPQDARTGLEGAIWRPDADL